MVRLCYSIQTSTPKNSAENWNSDSEKARKYNEESLLKALANEEVKDEQMKNLKWMLNVDLLELYMEGRK